MRSRSSISSRRHCRRPQVGRREVSPPSTTRPSRAACETRQAADAALAFVPYRLLRPARGGAASDAARASRRRGRRSAGALDAGGEGRRPHRTRHRSPDTPFSALPAMHRSSCVTRRSRPGRCRRTSRSSRPGQMLSALRRVAAGEHVVALLDQTQAAALPTLPFAAQLKDVVQSAPLPVALVAVVGPSCRRRARGPCRRDCSSLGHAAGDADIVGAAASAGLRAAPASRSRPRRREAAC
jgi:hypothetical protein